MDNLVHWPSFLTVGGAVAPSSFSRAMLQSGALVTVNTLMEPVTSWLLNLHGHDPICGLKGATTLTGSPGTPRTTGEMRNGPRTGGMQVGYPDRVSSRADIDRPYWA